MLGSFFSSLGVGLLRVLPPRFRSALTLGLARIVWSLGLRRKVTLDNLAQALPELTPGQRTGIARRAYGNMALAAVESVCFDLLTPAELSRAIAPTEPGSGWARLEARMQSRQPVLIASAHFGSWELLVNLIAGRGLPVSAVVRPLRGSFNARVVAARERSGVQLILPRGAMRGIFAALKEGRAVVQMIDQSIPARHGVFVPFFGRLASTTPSISLAALRTGAPVFTALAAREGSTLKMCVEGPIALPDTGDRNADVTAHTALLTASLERTIRQYPDQWLWLHRRWKVTPGQESKSPPVG